MHEGHLAVEYRVFFQTFGGAARSKNVATLWQSFFSKGSRKRNRRAFTIPGKSGLPKDFIRLCPWEMEYLFLVARRARHGILETGRFNGGSCFLMSCAAPDIPIYSIDIRPKNDEQLRKFFHQYDVGQNVHLIVGDSQKTKYSEIGKIDLLFVDGEHTYDGCMHDMLNWYDNLLPNGHLLVHDSYQGRWGVQDAVADFLDKHTELQIIQSPFIGAHYWHYPAGSLVHLIKRS